MPLFVFFFALPPAVFITFFAFPVTFAPLSAQLIYFSMPRFGHVSTYYVALGSVFCAMPVMFRPVTSASETMALVHCYSKRRTNKKLPIP